MGFEKHIYMYCCIILGFFNFQRESKNYTILATIGVTIQNELIVVVDQYVTNMMKTALNLMIKLHQHLQILNVQNQADILLIPPIASSIIIAMKVSWKRDLHAQKVY